MLKNVSKLQLHIGEKIYDFICDHDSPLEHVKEALFQFTKFVGQIEDSIRKTQEQQAEAAKNEQAEAPAEVAHVESAV